MDRPASGAPSQPVNVVEFLSPKSDERELIASVLRKDRKAAARLVAAHIDAVYACASLLAKSLADQSGKLQIQPITT